MLEIDATDPELGGEELTADLGGVSIRVNGIRSFVSRGDLLIVEFSDGERLEFRNQAQASMH